MDRVQFSEKEKTIWKELNEYLIGLLNPTEDISAMLENEKHQIIGQITYYGTATIRNKYSQAKPTFMKHNFDAYCNCFIEKHSHQLESERDINYTRFKSWAKAICNRAKWADVVKKIDLGVLAPNEPHLKYSFSEMDSTFLSIENILRLFTTEENFNNHRMLWQLISNECKNRLCNGKFSKFSELDFTPFKNLFFYNHKYVDANTIFCELFMQIRVFSLRGYCCYLHDLSQREDQWGLLESHLNQMLDMIHFDKDGNGVIDENMKDIKLIHVYETDICFNIENFFKALDINATNIHSILPLTKSAYFKAYGHAFFVYENNQWLINRVTQYDFMQHVDFHYPINLIPLKQNNIEEQE